MPRFLVAIVLLALLPLNQATAAEPYYKGKSITS
jgi:hypothetical protein